MMSTRTASVQGPPARTSPPSPPTSRLESGSTDARTRKVTSGTSRSRSSIDGALASAGSMPETPEELHARVAGALRMPPVEEWETFPFDGDMRPRPLAPPAEVDTPRRGEGGVDCDRCGGPDSDFFWANERWRLRAIGPTGLPLIAILEPREHYAEPGDLPDELAAELGVLQARIER